MIIGIDGNEANVQNRVGIGQFAFGVISFLAKIDQKNSYVIYLKNPPIEDLPKEKENWRYLIFGPKKYWTQIALPIKLFTQKVKPDIFYSPSHYSPRFSPIPTVISLMDLWHHRHPEQFTKKDLYQLTAWEKYSVRKASHVVTISEFSKKEILNIYKLSENKVTVAYPGYTKSEIRSTKSETNSKILEVKNKYKIKGDYFIYLGTLQPKKNLEGLIKAFGLLNSDLSLVIAGKKGWLFERIFNLVKELKLEDKVVFTDFIDEEYKPYLIAGARAFVFPSFYEGFGIPVLEAMSLGVPVITSNQASLPEVGGEAAIYADPKQFDQITQAMKKVLELNQEEKNEIIKRGYRQCEKFNWDKCASRILTVLEKNAKKN
jgi:glycosyltransferase involved in cell wall biosynthesis